MKTTRRPLAIPAAVLIALAGVAAAQENAWISHGPADVGVVNDVAIGDSVAYAATVNGVFRSDDGAATWRQTSFAGQTVTRIVAYPGTAVVLATVQGALQASRDRGETWAPIPGLPFGLAAIDPWNPSTLYVGTGDASVWRSTDAGSSWQGISKLPGSDSGFYGFAFDSTAVFTLTFDPSDQLVKLYRSSDSGVTWTLVSSLPSRSTGIGSGGSPGVLYSGIENGFCRSADSAATWTCSSFPASPLHILEIPGQGSGAAARIVTSAPDGVYVSTDAGTTWAHAGGELGSIRYRAGLASDASGSLVLAGTDVRVFRSGDRGESWTRGSTGLQASIIRSLAVDPQQPSTVWAGGNGLTSSSDPGLFRSTDSGLSWSPAGGPGSLLTAGALVIDPHDSSTLYGAKNDVYRSDDAGAHWTSSKPPGGVHVKAIAVDPDSTDRIWVASDAGLFRSDDGARTWNPTAAVVQGVYALLFDGRRPGTMYAASYFDEVPGYYPGYEYREGGSLFVSRDSGATFAKLDHDFVWPVSAIAVDPFDDHALYVGTSTGVSRSADDGATWAEPDPQLPNIGQVISLLPDPVRPGRLYAATDSGLLRTTDGARTWHSFSSGLVFQVGSLAISPDGRWLHAGTEGGGVFDLDLEPSQACSPSETRLCLAGGRYAIDLLAGRAGQPPINSGAAQPLGDRAGYFSLPFATGDPTLPEVIVKMLPDGAFGVAGAPLFYTSLTSLPFVLTVTDTVTGQVQTYDSRPDAPLCGGTDLVRETTGPWDYSARLLSGSAAAGETALHLLGGRFSVTLQARHPRSGRTANGVVMPSGDRFGFFSLPDFTGDPSFPEVAVKMVDFRTKSGKFWFFYSGLTSLDYTLTVTDSATGAVRTYPSTTPFCGGADTDAFTDSSPSSSGNDLSGLWSGTMRFPSDCFTCATESIHVTLAQNDNVVTGNLSTHCVGDRAIRGTLDGDRLTFDFDPHSGTGDFTGTATSTTLHVEKNCYPWEPGPDDTMAIDLSR